VDRTTVLFWIGGAAFALGVVFWWISYWLERRQDDQDELDAIGRDDLPRRYEPDDDEKEDSDENPFKQHSPVK